MSFLAPFFLLGALAVAGPVIFHLIRRVTREKTPFSSLMFLRPAPPRLTNKSHVEHWLLLLLRAAALALLAAAFARPFFRNPILADAVAPGKKVVVLVDVSASMSRTGLWEAAVKSANDTLGRLSPGDTAAVMLFDGRVRPVLGFDQWKAAAPGDRASLAAAVLAETKPGHGGTRLGAALFAAADLLLEGSAEDPKAGREIALISDIQEGGGAEDLQGREWPAEVKLIPLPVKAGPPGNAGLEAAASNKEESPDKAPGARVRVVNASDSSGETFQVGWANADGSGFAGKAQDTHVPPGRSALVTLPWPESGTGPAKVLMSGDGDGARFDNILTLTPPAVERRSVLYFGAESPDDTKRPLFFLRRALPDNRLSSVKAVAVSPDSAPSPEALADSSLLFLTGAAGQPATGAVHQAVENRGTAVIVLDSPEAGATVAALTGQPFPVEERKADGYAMLAKIDFAHPLFAPFSDPRFSDFTKIRFWKHRQVKASDLPGSRVVAEFDNGDPALLEAPLGKGRLLVLTSGWHPADSQLALSSKFPTLLASLLEWTGSVTGQFPSFIAGEPLALSLLAKFTGEGSVSGPDVKSAPVSGDGVFLPEQPGLYTLTWSGGSRVFPVNTDPRESLTAPLAVEDLEKLGVPAVAKASAAALTASPELSPAAEAEGRQKIWRYLLAAAMLTLVAETVASGITARRPAAA